MKRLLGTTLWVGTLSSAITIVLQKSGFLLRPETALGQLIFGEIAPNDGFGFWNYLLVVALGFAVAWSILQVAETNRRGLLLLLLVVELICAALVFALVYLFFQPFPAILVSLLAAALAAASEMTADGRQRRILTHHFRDRLAGSALTRLTESNLAVWRTPQTPVATFLFCEIANQAELIDELRPADCARLTSDFIAAASDLFLGEGGYLHAADGEGVCIVFGFPQATTNHAARAARAALLFRDRISVLAFKKPDSLGKIDLRIGMSSGSVVATVPDDEKRRDVVMSGEPVELARRLARANKVYGSQILLGPRAYSEATAEIVARPIDFLPSGEAHERLEVYELLALAAEASAEEIACRDRFWTALVYFRERRWAEAFNEFTHARRAGVTRDEPLQWYLRRLEPVILRMASEPAPAVEPLAPL